MCQQDCTRQGLLSNGGEVSATSVIASGMSKPHTLRQQGLSISAVARLMGLNRRTVTTLLAAESYPGIPTRGLTARAVAGFEAYLRQRWYAGMKNVMTRLSEIRTQGYQGDVQFIVELLSRP